MLDAICNYDPENPKTYSIFEFKQLPESKIEQLRYSLLCPVCRQKAYFRKASVDGKQACFGSRYHKTDCQEFNSSKSKQEEEKQLAEVEQALLESDSLLIDFGAATGKVKKDKQTREKTQAKRQKDVNNISGGTQVTELENKKEDEEAVKVSKLGLHKLLTSLLRGSSLAGSDLWVYTSARHKWRAKNLFVNIKDAQPTENHAPRIYWGTISHADKSLNWLNAAEDRNVAIPIEKYRDQLLTSFAVEEPVDVEGAAFILFGKCIASRDKKRRYIHLWDNDLQYFYLSKIEL
ncbi:hypothetical protein [Psychromonas sp.]|uniref:hypothetical protein n=1 Tax=Psychromonas sp. TaxID=1884585 RepID=UPI0035656AA2